MVAGRVSRVKSRGSNKVCKNHVIIRLFNIQYYIKFNIIFNIDILNEKLTADNNDQFGGYTRSATVQPGIASPATPSQTSTAYARTNIHQGYHVSRPFPPNVSFRFPTIQNDPPTIANANYYNIMTKPIFPQLPYIRPQLPASLCLYFTFTNMAFRTVAVPLGTYYIANKCSKMLVMAATASLLIGNNHITSL